jgi:hypothetical protein
MNDKHKIELNIPPVEERTAKWMADQMADPKHSVIVSEASDPVPPMLVRALAYGVSPSGDMVPIRVDEDGYVLVKVSTVVGTHGSKQ